jgi:hypothetical protein
MSGVENFEADLGNNEIPEQDPAADFIQREQDALAKIENADLGLTEYGSTEFTNDLNFVSESVNSEHMNGPSNNEPFPASIAPPRPANREEPEKIKIWREEQQKMLEIKDSEEEKKKLELKESAKKELDDWYARYKEQIEKSKLNNRNAEKEWVADRDAESPGQEWERIARLCDFNPKSSRSTKDTTRMRSIILQLKQSPIPPRKA